MFCRRRLKPRIMLPPDEFVDRAKQIKLLICDVDGVLTDGGIIVNDQGLETKNFNVRDGFGIKAWQHAGREVAIISGRRAEVVNRRCQELGIHHVFQGSTNKVPAFERLLDDLKLSPQEVCHIGDDLPDMPLMLSVGIGATVSDAVAEVLGIADWISQYPGGKGAVRQLIEDLLKAQGAWATMEAMYRRPALATK